MENNNIVLNLSNAKINLLGIAPGGKQYWEN